MARAGSAEFAGWAATATLCRLRCGATGNMNPTTTTGRTPNWPDLTTAHGDTATLRSVMSGFQRTQLRVLLTIPAQAVNGRIRPLLNATQQQVKALAKQDRGAALRLLQWPTHNVLLAVTSRALRPGGERSQLSAWVEELCLLLWLELARLKLLGGRSLPWQLRPDGPALRSIPANLLVAADTSPVQVTLRNGELALQSDGRTVIDLCDPTRTLPEVAATLRRPYYEIVPGVVLATCDNNPLSDFEAHPDKDGNTLSLGGHPASHWADVLRQCFALVDAELPLLGEELRVIARQIVPVGFDAERHLSASYQEAIGSAYLSLHPNLMTMTEAVIHEFQHNKLNAAAYLDPLLNNAFFPLFASPVRPDPRPLWGVLLAVHAFQPVAQLYRAMQHSGHADADSPSFRRRFEQIVAKNHDAATTVIDNADATSIGAQLLAEIGEIDAAFEAMWPQEVQL
jgi:HEXXH motif-containing protein